MPIGNKLGKLATKSKVNPERDFNPALDVRDVGGTLTYAQAGGLALPRNYRAGLITSNAADTAHDITIAVGQCRDATNTTNITLETAITKQFDFDWAEGTDAGGLAADNVRTADTTYHVYLIKHTAAITAITDAGGGDITCACAHLVTTNSRVTISGTKNYDGDYAVTAISAGVSFNVTAAFVSEPTLQTGTYETVDAGFDDNTDASELLSDSGYTYYRRVASVVTDGSIDILEYLQHGNHFLFQNPGTDGLLESRTSGGTEIEDPPDYESITLSHIPTGFKVIANFNLYWNDAQAGGIYLYHPDVTDEAPSDTVAPLSTSSGQVTARTSMNLHILTNTSGQIRAVSRETNIDNTYFATLGWYDFLGDDD